MLLGSLPVTLAYNWKIVSIASTYLAFSEAHVCVPRAANPSSRPYRAIEIEPPPPYNGRQRRRRRMPMKRISDNSCFETLSSRLGSTLPANCRSCRSFRKCAHAGRGESASYRRNTFGGRVGIDKTILCRRCRY